MRNQVAAFAALSALLVAAPALAQTPLLADDDFRQDLFSGLGGSTLGPLDLEVITGQPQSLGVGFLAGEIYITSRGSAGATTPPHTCTVLDSQGNVVRQFIQVGSQASVWGWRDMATDGVATMIVGYESTLDFIDPTGNQTTTVVAANGPQTVTPITIPTFTGTALGTLRALAFNPNGNGGNGSIFAADFGSDIVELDLGGTEIGRIPHDGAWSIYGMAMHPVLPRLWVNSSPDGLVGRIVEIDLVSGLPTGAAFDHDTGIQGGLSVAPGGVDGRGRGFDILSVVQGAPDLLQGHRIDLYNGVDGTQDVDLLVGIDGGTASTAARRFVFGASSTWDLDLDDGDPTPRTLDIAAYAINVPAFAGPNGGLDPVTASLFPTLVEIRYLDAFTTPAGFAIVVPTTEAAGPLSLGVPSILGLTVHGDALRVQGIYADLNVPAVLGPAVQFTNQSRLVVDENPAFGVTVTATGANSFNAVTTSGFWQIANNGPFEIVEATMILPTGMVWDPDQTGMADRFDGGNSLLATCLGTYRNSSDTTTDLDYIGTPAATCDATAQQGFQWPAADTITFRFLDSAGPNGGFTSGEVFEWDTDTDGGGLPGDAHAGTLARITVRDPVTGNLMVSQRYLDVTPAANQAGVTF